MTSEVSRTLPRDDGPLAGLRVIELAGIGPGPMSGLFLAQLGADVIRVRRPGQPQDVAWPVTMAGRRHVDLDLKSEAGREDALALVRRADVLIDPFRPGVLERLGLGPARCHELNPLLIFARMTGWGQTGPWAHMAGHDINYIAVTGVLDAIGRRDGPPQIPLNLLGDFGGGSMFLLTGVLAALHERSSSGRGQVVDVSIVDGVVALSGYIHGMRAVGTWTDERGTNRLDSGAPYYDVYETADGKWMAVGAVESQFWAALVRALGLAELMPHQLDRSQWPRLREMLASRFKLMTQAEWTAVFSCTDACVTPVLSWTEAEHNPQLRARGSLRRRGAATIPAPAPVLSRTPAREASAPTESASALAEVLDSWA